MKSVFILLSVFTLTAFAGLEITSSTQDGVIFDLHTPEPEIGVINLSGEDFASISLWDSSNLSDFSFPRIPVYRKWLEVPIGAEIEVTVFPERLEILPSGTISMDVEPAVLSASKSESRESFTMEFNSSVYFERQAYPQSWVRIIEGGMMRGRNLVLVEVMPVRWHPSDGSLEILGSATIEVNFTGGDLAETFYQAEHYYAPHFEVMLDHMVDNYGTFSKGDPSDTPPAPYLIIAHDDFAATAMDDFITHKESLGFDMTLVNLSTTGSSEAAIKTYIHDALENPDPPVYVLLVGDTNFLPGGTATEYGGVTDLHYSALEDGGYFPDCFLGRFSVTTIGECVLMAQRVIDYETLTGSEAWLQNTCWVASNDNWEISQGTHDYCIDNCLTPHGYTWDKVYPHEGGSAADAIASTNGGISLFTFSGHGSTTGWGDMSFGQSHFDQLTNGSMLPGVMSHSCVTGDYSYGTAWCETWTRTPTRGGLWFWGSAPSSYWTEDDVQERAQYEWFLLDIVYWPMGFLNGGLLDLYDFLGGAGRSKYYFEGYNLMGDPSVAMWIWNYTGIVEEETGTPVQSGLVVLSPNPVRAITTVNLSGFGQARLDVFDISGRLVSSPFQGKLAGDMSITWDTSELATGIYFLHLTQGNQMTTARVTVLR